MYVNLLEIFWSDMFKALLKEKKRPFILISACLTYETASVTRAAHNTKT